MTVILNNNSPKMLITGTINLLFDHKLSTLMVAVTGWLSSFMTYIFLSAETAAWASDWLAIIGTIGPVFSAFVFQVWKMKQTYEAQQAEEKRKNREAMLKHYEMAQQSGLFTKDMTAQEKLELIESLDD